MYSIVTENDLSIPTPDHLPIKLIIHPSLTGDAIKLIAYIISEYYHNPRADFIKEICQKNTGIKRCALNAAINSLTELHILSLYNNNSKIPVIELDYTGLLELIEFSPTNIIRAGHSMAAIDYRRNQHSKEDYAF
jgi:hypothetical protein